jgi:hypothetical protein
MATTVYHYLRCRTCASRGRWDNVIRLPAGLLPAPCVFCGGGDWYEAEKPAWAVACPYCERCYLAKLGTCPFCEGNNPFV